MKLITAAILGVLMSATGCNNNERSSTKSPDKDSGTNAPHDLQSIEITPGNSVLEVDFSTPASQIFVATAHFADGTNEDISNDVEWNSKNKNLGTFEKGTSTLKIAEAASLGADSTQITATYKKFHKITQLTVVYYAMTGDHQGFFFLLPHMDDAGEKKKPLLFNTDVPALDVFFNMDTTKSMTDYIKNLKDSLIDTVIPGVENVIANSWFGVGRFDDFPISPYGSAKADQPFTLVTEMTDDNDVVKAGVDSLLNLHSGTDAPESIIESLYQIATGEGLSGPAPINVPPNDSGVGGVGFRSYSMPAVVVITDTNTHTVDEGNDKTDYSDKDVLLVAHKRSEAINALNKICARVIGVATDYGNPDNRIHATLTGARVPPEAWGKGSNRPDKCDEDECCTEVWGRGRKPDNEGLCPLAFTVNNSGLGLCDHIVTGMNMLTKFAPFDVKTKIEGNTESLNGSPLPAGHTTADFIKSIVPTGYTMPDDPDWLPKPTLTDTAFKNVTPGIEIEFDVSSYNDVFPSSGDPQFFKATISVLAGGCTPLDERDVLILVPPTIIE